MASEPLVYLAYLSLIFIMGTILNMFSNKINIPNMLFLLAFGILLNCLRTTGILSISLPQVFIASIGLLALVMVIFDSASRFRVTEFERSKDAIKLSVIFLTLNLIFLTLFTKFLFGIKNTFLALAFSALISGTSFILANSSSKKYDDKVMGFLKSESIINTLPVVLLPFVFIGLIGIFSNQKLGDLLMSSISPLFTQIIAGIGTGIIIGLIFFKFMRRYYSPLISPIATVTAALIAYVLAENLGGNGILAVAVLGLFFGNISIKSRDELQKFSFMLIAVLEVFIFIILVLITPINLTFGFLLNSIVLFIIFLLIRLASIDISFSKKEFTIKEKLFIALISPKGITEAVVAIAISSFLIPQIETVLALVLLFLIYSIIISTITLRFYKMSDRTKIAKP